MSTTDTRSLLSAPSAQTAVDVEPPSGRSSRTYKVTGLTLLACVLIMGQATITYFLVTQRNDIKSLQSLNDEMRTQLSKIRSVSVPGRMHVPMKTMAMLDEEISVGDEPKEAVPRTRCQLESEGLKPLRVPTYRPLCDQQGLYQRQQCFADECWCVSPLTGEQIPGSAVNGKARCGSSGVLAAMPVPVVDTFE